MRILALRSMVLFFRDRAAVCLSCLTELILVGLYALFLRKNLLAALPQLENAALLLDVWMTAGVLGVSPVTAAIAVCGVMVDDRVKRIDRDFRISPAGAASRLCGYWLAAACVGFLTSFLLLLAGAGYIARRYGVRLGAGNIPAVWLELLLSAAANAAYAALPVTFLKSGGALAGFCSVSGALIGFLTGIYLPVGTLPAGVRWIVVRFPTAHAAALLRQSLLSPLLPESAVGAEAARYLGVWYEWNGHPVPVWGSVLLLALSAGLCLLAACAKTAAEA